MTNEEAIADYLTEKAHDKQVTDALETIRNITASRIRRAGAIPEDYRLVVRVRIEATLEEKDNE